MSKLWRCDACGKEATAWTKGDWELVKIKRFRSTLLTADGKEINWDLCQDCTERLIEYMTTQKAAARNRSES